MDTFEAVAGNAESLIAIGFSVIFDQVSPALLNDGSPMNLGFHHISSAGP